MQQDTTNVQSASLDELFTIKEVTEKLKISRFTLDRLTKEKGIPTLKIGDSIRYTGEAVAKLIEQVA